MTIYFSQSLRPMLFSPHLIVRRGSLCKQLLNRTPSFKTIFSMSKMRTLITLYNTSGTSRDGLHEGGITLKIMQESFRSVSLLQPFE